MYKVAKPESIGEDVKSHKSNRHSKDLDLTNLQIITYFLLEFDDGNERSLILYIIAELIVFQLLYCWLMYICQIERKMLFLDVVYSFLEL
jgi:hypothetical protein